MLMHKLVELNRKVHNFYEQKNANCLKELIPIMSNIISMSSLLQFFNFKSTKQKRKNYKMNQRSPKKNQMKEAFRLIDFKFSLSYVAKLKGLEENALHY